MAVQNQITSLTLEKAKRDRELRNLKSTPGSPEFSIPKSAVDGDTRPNQIDLAAKAQQLFLDAREEWFEAGMDSPFSIGVERMILEFGSLAVDQIGTLVFSRQTPDHVAAEAAKTMGNIDHPSSSEARRVSLEKALCSESHHVRDAAGLGLDSMNDPLAVPALSRAIGIEHFPSLKADLQAVLNHLMSDAGAS